MKSCFTLFAVGVCLITTSVFAETESKAIPNALQSDVILKYGETELKWYDGADLTIFGKGFKDTPSLYSRLPVRADKKFSDQVWNLSKNTAGINLRFISNMSQISATWTNNPPMGHMAYSGSGGLDLYKKNGDKWEFAGVGVPGGKETTQSLTTYTKLDGKMHEYMLYLPLYSPVKYVKLGINKDAVIAPAPKSQDKPIVFYGTSITQGGCASRAGMSHTSILGRWFNKEVINLGFSGSGRSEIEMAEFISEIDASLFVVEPIPNMSEELINERSLNFCNLLREKHPNTPILIVLAPTVPDDDSKNVAFKKVYQTLVDKGDKNVYLLGSKEQFDGIENPTVDGVHPTDLGFYRMAKAYEPVLTKIFK